MEGMEKAVIALGYNAMGIEAYHELTKETNGVKKEFKQCEKEYGKARAEKIMVLSKLHVLEEFLTLKSLTTEDENTLIDELCSLAKKLYELKGE